MRTAPPARCSESHACRTAGDPPLAENLVQRGESLLPAFRGPQHGPPSPGLGADQIAQADHPIGQFLHRHAQEHGGGLRREAHLNADLPALVHRVHRPFVQTHDERTERRRPPGTGVRLGQERIRQADDQDDLPGRGLPTLGRHRGRLPVAAVAEERARERLGRSSFDPRPGRRRVAHPQQHAAMLFGLLPDA
jgi:hypothetical protein